MDEYFDVVDENDKIIGKALRSECHSNPKLIHRGVDVVIVNEKGEILLQKRSSKKDTNPGKWEIMGGHPLPGESYKEAALRELKEELRLSGRIRKITKFLYKTKRETEFNEIYLLKIRSKSKIAMDPMEVCDAKFVSLHEAESIIRTRRVTFCTKIVFNKYKKHLGK